MTQEILPITQMALEWFWNFAQGDLKIRMKILITSLQIWMKISIALMQKNVLENNVNMVFNFV